MGSSQEEDARARDGSQQGRHARSGKEYASSEVTEDKEDPARPFEGEVRQGEERDGAAEQRRREHGAVAGAGGRRVAGVRIGRAYG